MLEMIMIPTNHMVHGTSPLKAETEDASRIIRRIATLRQLIINMVLGDATVSSFGSIVGK